MNEPSSDPKRRKVVSLLKKKFHFEQARLTPIPIIGENILSKCFDYNVPKQARDLEPPMSL